MKKYFKKSLAILLAVLMLSSVMSVSVFAVGPYTITFSAEDGLTESGTTFQLETAANGRLTIPSADDANFVRKGYTLIAWNREPNKTTATYRPGRQSTFRDDTTVYPVWKIAQYDCEFIVGEGATAEGTTQYIGKNYLTVITPPSATKPDYVLIGWSKTEGSTVPEIAADEPFELQGDTVYYAVWGQPIYGIDVNKAEIKVERYCVGTTRKSATFDIVNTGNQTMSIEPIQSDVFDFTYSSTDRKFPEGGALTVTVTPKEGLSVGEYSETLAIIGSNSTSASIKVSASIVDHVFEVYESLGDATYTQDGHKVAQCLNGCGEEDYQLDVGSMKVYSADNNTVIGLIKEYNYHKTVRFTAYGSGTDDYEYEIENLKRFVPVSWYVNEQYNGTFEDGNYDVVYVHDSFGDYTLTVKYVEMQLAYDEAGDPMVDEDGNPVFVECKDAEGNVIEDVKEFKYTVGPSDKEIEDVVRPNMIVNIIFGLFGYLFELISGLFG